MRSATFILACTLGAAAPLQVASVERTGLPPYEGPRIYRIEGGGCATLRIGEILILRREGDPRQPGRLEVLSVHGTHAQAKLAVPGETFPLKGDVAVRTELLQVLPTIPPAAPGPLPPPQTFQPTTLAPAPPEASAIPSREPIFFLAGDASLSPGAYLKLQAWTEGWGREGRWWVECPQVQAGGEALAQARIAVLATELQRLGIAAVHIRYGPAEAGGRYDAIYVMREPW